MVVRPSDWFLVGFAVDPTPGDAFGIRGLAQKYADIAAIAGEASSGVRNARSSGSASAWVGDAAEVFRDRSSRMPGELLKANESYQTVADALRVWAESVDDTQAQADRGLQQAREAHHDLLSAQAALGAAEVSWTTAHAQQLTYQTLVRTYSTLAAPVGVKMPTDYQLRSVDRNAHQAQASIASAQQAIASADARLAAARSLVVEAKTRRDDAERHTVHQILEAKGQAVKPSSVWEAIQDSAAWQTVITIATIVLTIVSIVALFVGGPIVWAILLVATAVLLLNALLSIAQGKNAWGELAMLAIGLIPGGRFLTLGGRLLSTVAKMGVVGERFATTIDRLTTAVLRFTRLRPANAAINRVARSAITDIKDGTSLVWRKGMDLPNVASTFRADSRPAEIVFKDGFAARDLTETRFDHFINTSDKSAFVSTSHNPHLADHWTSPTPGDPAASGMYRYTIDAPGGIDVGPTYHGNDPFKAGQEMEVTMPGGVRPEFIKEAWEVGPGGQLINQVLNPNYIPKLFGLFG